MTRSNGAKTNNMLTKSVKHLIPLQNMTQTKVGTKVGIPKSNWPNELCDSVIEYLDDRQGLTQKYETRIATMLESRSRNDEQLDRVLARVGQQEEIIEIKQYRIDELKRDKNEQEKLIQLQKFRYKKLQEHWLCRETTLFDRIKGLEESLKRAQTQNEKLSRQLTGARAANTRLKRKA